MTDLTGKKIANTYKDLLQINSSASNSGVDGTLRRIQDGGGNNSAISLSQNEAKVHGNLAVTGNVSADSINLNGIDVSAINAVEVSATRINATSITTDKLDATTLVFQDVSVSSLRAGTVSATTLAATTNITLAGDNVATSASLAATSAELRGAIVSIESIISSNVAYVSAAQVSVLAVIQGMQNNISTNSTHINTVSATLSATDDRLKTSIANVSAALETRIAAVSAEVSAVKALVTATNASAIAANTSAISVNSAAITSINAAISAGAYASAETSVNLETRVANLSSTMATSIDNSNAAITSVNTRINAVSVLAETKASASTSANLETRINAVSILAETKASASTSVNLETRINAVSILAETKASASTSVNLETRINAVSVLAETKASASTSANVQTQIATLSSTMATSIDNQMPKAGGTFTGAVTFNNEGFTVSSTASAVFNGPARFNSSINLGNSSGDLISTTGRFSGDLIPNSTTGRDLGTDSLRWDNAYINTLRGGINAIGTSVTDLIYPSAYGNAPANVNYVTSAVATKASAGTSATLETRIAGVSSTMATSISNHLPLSGGTLTGALTLNADPTANLGAATKQYVDNLTAAGIHLHDAVRVETPSALTATYNNGTAGVGATLTNSGTQAALSIDGITLSTSDRVLVRQQSNQAHNGVYVVTNVGSASTNWILTRSDDADSAGDGSPDTLDEGSYFFVNEGDTGAGDAYVCNTQGTITFGTTNITFAKFSDSLEYTAGTGININASRVIATSGVATTTQLAALSATLATSIANVSALIPTSLTELNISDGTNGQVLQTDGSSNFTFVSIAAGGGGGSGTMTELKAGTNIALVENGTTVTETTTSATINVVGVASAGTSAALETRIAAVSVLTSVNAAAIASVDTIAKAAASASTSVNLETRINAVSVLAETKASASTSANLETRINAVSVLAETKASASTSANLQTRINAVSATMATSIANRTAAITSVNTRINSVSAAIPTNNNQLINGAGYVTTDTNTTYTANGNYGLTLVGTEFRLENDRRRNSTSEDIYSGNTHDYTFYDASVGIRWYTTGAEEMRLEDDGDLHVDGNIVAYSTTVSDKRLKKNILSIDNALWRVKQLNGCTFTYLKDDRKSAGLIAQDVEKVLPSAVIDTEAVFHGEEGETYKTLQYDQVIGLLVEAVKELAAKVEELENASSR